VKRFVLLLVAAAVMLGAAPAEPAGFAELAAAFRAAHQAGDIQAFKKIICWDGVDGPTRASVLGSIQEDFGGSIEKISFDPLKPDDPLEYELHGVTYRPNLQPIGWLVVQFHWVGVAARPSATRTQYLVGRKDGHLLIASAAPAQAGNRGTRR
jgi:hypothetical protein